MAKQLVSLFILSFVFIHISQVAFSQEKIIDVPYSFDQEKLDAAKDPFQFFRSYVDYFYLLLKANEKQFPTLSKNAHLSGFCVGDAHPENFGTLIQENSSALFTVNDVDDAGPCPLIYDFARYLVSLKIYSSKIKISQIFEAYINGVQTNSPIIPNSVDHLLVESKKRGKAAPPKKIDHGKLVRDSKATEVSEDLKAEITKEVSQALKQNINVLDLFQTQKIGGGSGGRLRFEILADLEGQLHVYELKEQVTPSIYPVSTGIIPETNLRIEQALMFEQGPRHSKEYHVISISNHHMLLRPCYDGNIGFNLSHQENKENQEIMSYEANILGQIHILSLNEQPNLAKDWLELVQSLNEKDLDSEIQQLAEKFEEKFKQLKTN